MLKQLSNGSPEGVQLGQNAADKVGFHGRAPAPQRSTPSQSVIPPVNGALVVTYCEALTPALIAANTAAEQALTVGLVAGSGVLATDFLAAIAKPTTQAGIGFHKGRISAACTLQFVFSNTTAGNLTPTAAEGYQVVCLRGFPIIGQALTPAAIPIRSTSEQEFDITPVTAVATATIQNGKVVDIRVINGGANYWCSPTVLITGLDNTQTPMSGTYTGTGADPSLPGATNALAGFGATGEAIVVAGVVIGVRITNPGEGYTVAPTVSFVGGNNIMPGMALMVTKPTTNAGCAIGGCRVVSDNRIAITFINPTAAVVTPTAAEVYSMVALNPIPAMSNLMAYGVDCGVTPTSALANTTTENAFVVTGLVATDICIGAQKPTFQAGMGLIGGRVTGANALNLLMTNPTAGNITPTASEIYEVLIFREMPVSPFIIFKQLLTPVSVAANTTAEQQFTVTPIPAGATLVINKPSHQTGLAIAGCRVSAANTIQITYENLSAVAITPTAEVYTIGVFTTPGPGFGHTTSAGVPGNWAAVCARPALIQGVDLSNEMQTVMVSKGLIRG